MSDFHRRLYEDVHGGSLSRGLPKPSCAGPFGYAGFEAPPRQPLGQAARASRERMYDVATGSVPPFDDSPEYLPKLFL